MNRFKKHVSTLKLLHKAKPSLRKAIISNGNDELIRCICECALNVLQGHVPISQQHKNCLSRPKKRSVKVNRSKSLFEKQVENYSKRGLFRCLQWHLLLVVWCQNEKINCLRT